MFSGSYHGGQSTVERAKREKLSLKNLREIVAMIEKMNGIDYLAFHKPS